MACSPRYCSYVNRDPKAPAIVPGVRAEEMGAVRKSGSQSQKGRALKCLSWAGNQHFLGYWVLCPRGPATLSDLACCPLDTLWDTIGELDRGVAEVDSKPSS